MTRLKCTPEIIKELRKTVELLPPGSLGRIAADCGVNQSYVSRFFNGAYYITPENEKIIDAAIRILEESAMNDKRIMSKLITAKQQNAA